VRFVGPISRVLDGRAAREIAAQLDLAGIDACPLCLSELAWQLHQGRTPTQELVSRTVCWTWPEIKDALEASVIGARMREVMHAEDALHDLQEEKWGSALVARVVCLLAERLASDLRDEGRFPF
jgi:hypothetical protein